MSNTWHRPANDDHRATRSGATRNKYPDTFMDDDLADEDFGSRHDVRPLRGAGIYEQTRKKAQKNTRKTTR